MSGNRRPRSKPKVAEANPADLELFASFVRAEEQQERDAKKAARDERRKADELDQLTKAKEDAAAQVKRLRGNDRATAEQKTEADGAYKVALAAVVAAETGETPAWAPPAPAPEEAHETEGESPRFEEPTDADLDPGHAPDGGADADAAADASPATESDDSPG